MPDLPLVSPLERLLFLRTQPHFARLAPDELVLIANHSDEQSFRKGEIILEESISRPYLYFLVEGTVRTTIGGKTLFDVSPPGGVGLAHELARTDVSTGAFALTDVVTLRIEVENFFQIMEDRFPVTIELLQFFTRMTADVEEKLAIAPGSDSCVECFEAASDKTLDLVQRLSRARQVFTRLVARSGPLARRPRGDREVRDTQQATDSGEQDQKARGRAHHQSLSHPEMHIPPADDSLSPRSRRTG